MKRYLIQIVVLIGSLIILSGCSLATSSGIKIEANEISIKKGSEAEIIIKSEQNIDKFRIIATYINFNEDIMDIDITNEFGDNVESSILNYEYQNYALTLKEPIDIKENDVLFKVKIKLKENIDIKDVELSFEDVSLIDLYSKEYWFEGEVAKIKINITDKEETEDLYLSTPTYKIGEGETEEQIRNYQKGDEHITQIPPNTTFETFINNLETNGKIIRISSIEKKDKDGVVEINEIIHWDKGSFMPKDGIVETGMKLTVMKEGSEPIELEIIVDEEDKLYLRSNVYKIGENKPNEYDESDKIIYKISSGTKLRDFIKEENLQTNGTITVYKQEIIEQENPDGTKTEHIKETPLELDQLVGTGMKLKVSKEGTEDNIELVISVIGDTSGDGLVQPDDLADTVQATLGQLKLAEALLKAVDMDEDGEITPADLADEVKFVLR